MLKNLFNQTSNLRTGRQSKENWSQIATKSYLIQKIWKNLETNQSKQIDKKKKYKNFHKFKAEYFSVYDNNYRLKLTTIDVMTCNF